MLLNVGQLAFCGCVALGLTVKSADVPCAIQAVTVPIGTRAPSQQSDTPCDADEPSPDATACRTR